MKLITHKMIITILILGYKDKKIKWKTHKKRKS